MKTPSKTKTAVFTAASNPAFQWLLAIAVGALFIVYLIPWVIKRTFGQGGAVGNAFDSLKGSVSGAVDSASGELASIIGTSDQMPDERTVWDEIKGLFLAGEGDRTWSNIGSLSGGDLFNGTAQEYMALLKSLGYMDGAGNLTPAGKAAILAGTIPKMPNV